VGHGGHRSARGHGVRQRSPGAFHPPVMTLAEFRARLRSRFKTAYELHRDVAHFLEPAVATPRKLVDEIHLALDMLLVQAYKAHLSVLRVADLGHMEDAATLARRLLELAVTAGYLGVAGTPTERQRRAVRYLADLWTDLPPEGRAVLPAPIQARWQAYTVGVERGALPSVQKMFSELRHQPTYDADYRLLTRIAHGASSDQIIAYTCSPVQVRATWHIGTLLVYASRYYLATSMAWNEHFHSLDESRLSALVERIEAWAAAHPPESAAH